MVWARATGAAPLAAELQRGFSDEQIHRQLVLRRVARQLTTSSRPPPGRRSGPSGSRGAASVRACAPVGAPRMFRCDADCDRTWGVRLHPTRCCRSISDWYSPAWRSGWCFVSTFTHLNARVRNGSLLSDAKGRFAETIISTLLEHAGYRVLRLGVEEVVSEVKAGVARGERTLQLPDQLRTAPDFLVVDPATGECTLLEVKFRGTFDDRVATGLHAVLTRQATYWPEAVTAIVCADPPGSSKATDVRGFIGCLRATDLDRLIETHDHFTKWQRLRTLGGIFDRAADLHFYQQAEVLIAPIRGWS
jgi:hypothetical protein